MQVSVSSALLLEGSENQINQMERKVTMCYLAEQMKAITLNSHIVAFENSGHSLFLEKTLKFNAELIKFAGK
jgi:pimeloyl-ACP methyl ester carboxylesterase